MRRMPPLFSRYRPSSRSLSLPCLMLAALSSHCSLKPYCGDGSSSCSSTLSLQASQDGGTLVSQDGGMLVFNVQIPAGIHSYDPDRAFLKNSTYDVNLYRPDGKQVDPAQINTQPVNPNIEKSPLQLTIAPQNFARLPDDPVHPRSGPLRLHIRVAYDGKIGDYHGSSDQPLRAHPAFQPGIAVDYSAAPMNARPAALQIGTVADGSQMGLFVCETFTDGLGTELRQIQRYVARGQVLNTDNAWRIVQQSAVAPQTGVVAAGPSGLLIYPDATGNLATATYPAGAQYRNWAGTVASIPKMGARIVNGAVTDSTWFILQTDSAVLPFRFARDFLATTTDYSKVLALTPPVLPVGSAPLRATARSVVMPDQPRMGNAYDVAAWRGADELFLLRFRSQSPDTLSLEATVKLNELVQGQAVQLSKVPLSVTLVDLDDDGWQDLLVLPDTENTEPGRHLLWAPRTGGTATAPTFGALRSTGLALPAALDIAAGDLDNNGLPDVAVLSGGSTKNSVTVYLNQGRYGL